MERLQKIIAASGICSRRKAEELIATGHVKVDGKIVNKLGVSFDPSTVSIMVDNRPLPVARTVTYLVNKPRGVVCSRVAQDTSSLVTSLVPAFPLVYPVGRLDKESEGLILLTNDGALAQRLTHPSFEHVREYRVWCSWRSGASEAKRSPEIVKNKLLKGVKLSDKPAKATGASITVLDNGILELQISVQEGRHHLIRRMCATVGLDVRRLQRVRVGPLRLERLQPGKYRSLTPQELRSIAA